MTVPPIGTKQAKKEGLDAATIFKTFSLGVNTARDSLVYDSHKAPLRRRVQKFSDDYNAEVFRYIGKGRPADVDTFVNYELFKWSRNLKRHFKNGDTLDYSESNIRTCLYRPFLRKWLYFSDVIVDEPAANLMLFPSFEAEAENFAISVNTVGSNKPFHCLMVNLIPDYHLTGDSQVFPLYTYRNNNTARQENITDWSLTQFQDHFKCNDISKLDIFHYAYAVLHHPQYREKYAANLKRELPRIPFAPDFWEFAKAGKRLAKLHINYEGQAEHSLTWLENSDAKVNYRVERMTLSKDKTQIVYNDFLTLGGIPQEVFEYRLGNRSALDWIIDQYQISTDKRSGIDNDPNKLDDPQYIIRLIGKVITVSLETVKIVKSLPALQ